jgi:hypothetical protein
MPQTVPQVDKYLLLAYARAELRLLRAEQRNERPVRVTFQESRAEAAADSTAHAEVR